MIEFCRGCGQKSLSILFEPRDGCNSWYSCVYCGSHTHEDDYHPEIYDYDYSQRTIAELGNYDACKAALSVNADWFVQFQDKVRGRDFLDIGYAEGAGLTAMQDRGWSVHGFDVVEKNYLGTHTTVRPFFDALWFPRKYDGVMAREVIEHVPDWRNFLFQCAEVTKKNGLFQLQTPRPQLEWHPIPYQKAHLVILSPMLIENTLHNMGFHILDKKIWDLGQAYMCQKVGGFQ